MKESEVKALLVAPHCTGWLSPVVQPLDTLIRYACAVTLWVSFLVMLLPTFFNAVLRYTTDSSLSWSVEIIQLIFPWFIMAGAVLAAQHSRHIGVSFFLSICSERIAKYMTLFVQQLILIGCITVCYVYLGFGEFEGGMEFAAGDVAFTSLGVSQSWSYLALLVGYMLLGLTALTTFYRILVGTSPTSDVTAEKI
ncbi:TRAP transporter small permease [Vibrio penaeicida]|uniref:TRAP transporter small permease n=1 Tax=Vibrio penaeicida TaxID=104609 RepID=UPI000CE9C142|nr:TRAP transporter small permease subunit [Vibrio penaeicida]